MTEQEEREIRICITMIRMESVRVPGGSEITLEGICQRLEALLR